MPASVHCTDFWVIICCFSRCNLLSWKNYKLPPPLPNPPRSTSCSDSSRQSWRFKLATLEDSRSLVHARWAGWLFSEHCTYHILCISIMSFPTNLSNWNVMTHAQKPYFVFRRNRRVHLNRRGRQFSRLLAAEVCASAVVMLDAPCSEVVWRVLATHSFQ